MRVFNRGIPPDSFLTEQVEWARTAPDELFAPNTNYDIYNKVSDELGPWRGLVHRKAVILEVERVLAGFESEWKHNEGVDISRRSDTTNENAEAGAWQVSWNNRRLDPSLKAFLNDAGISDGVTFQHEMKSNHFLSMEFITRLLRIDIKNFNRINNGPVRKGVERMDTWPDRRHLWLASESIYPWLSRAAVTEYQGFLSA